jgi:triphosphoribosyl-dephospho-CoA synthase
MTARAAAPGRIERAFGLACAWDVAVRKPGNVSRHSAGHGMQAQTFLDSAAVAAPALCRAGARVGDRIEAAMAATWARVGCNTNLGILLLTAPLAVAAERCGTAPLTEAALRPALAQVLGELDREDAAAAFRAIAQANPGGLGRADAQDVREPPTVTLREAMALAAARDRIARLYRDGFAELFDIGLAALGPAGLAALTAADGGPDQPSAAQVAAVQGVYLAWLASAPDSHLVRKHGTAVAQVVLNTARPWAQRGAAADPAQAVDGDPAFAAWDETLKSAGWNPGTSADLTVATLLVALLCAPLAARRVARGAGGEGGTERD